MQHPEEYYLSEGGVMNSSSLATRLGLPGIPKISEILQIERDIPLIVVSNSNLLNVNCDAFGTRKMKNVLNARNYVEAAGMVLVLRTALNIESLYRPFSGIEKLL